MRKYLFLALAGVVIYFLPALIGAPLGPVESAIWLALMGAVVATAVVFAVRDLKAAAS